MEEPGGVNSALSRQFTHLAISRSATNTNANAGERILSVKDIYFSQRTVSESFSDGRPLSQVINQLINGTTKPDQIPKIRVVFFQGRWFTLDNRRLRVFAESRIPQLTVIVCDINQEEVYREFQLKRTNKTIEGGGVVHASRSGFAAYSDNSHFDDGVYLFTKIILSKNFTQLQQPESGVQIRDPLPTDFRSWDYFDAFMPLIMEEARAIIQRGLEAAEKGQEPKIQGRLLDNVKIARNAGNPSTLYFAIKESMATIKSGDMILITQNKFRIIGMANYLSPTDEQRQICVKIIIDEAMRSEFVELLRDQHLVWHLQMLGSLITVMRMFDVFRSRLDIRFKEQLITGQIEPQTSNSLGLMSSYYSMPTILRQATTESELPTEIKNELTTLNPSQNQAVQKFLRLDQGLQLIQGPPGTGKTTTIITLLKVLSKKPQRILVSAPSNKAVQILAERFALTCPQIPIVLVGVEDKLPDNPTLEKIFIHSWKKQMLHKMSDINGFLQQLHLPMSEKESDPVKITTKQFDTWNNTIVIINGKVQDLFQALRYYPISILSDLSRQEKTLLSCLSEYKILLTIDCKQLFAPSLDWITQYKRLLGELIGTLCAMLLQLQNKDDEVIELALLNSSQLIFSTLSVSGRQTFKKMAPIEILIVDEAGQAVEAETMIPMQTKPKKCLLVGDTKQLPATVISTLAEEKKFGRSLLWRLLEDCKQPFSLLDEQYRMHPHISVWPSKRFYENRIKNAANVVAPTHQLLQLKDASDFLCPYAFIDVAGQEESGGKEGYSFCNQNEAAAVLSLVQCLHHKFNISVVRQVGIITFYKGQADLLNRMISPSHPGINIQTVDGFQGGENDIIIISFVRANPRGNVGFLKDFRRLNVALTRARFSLLMVGHGPTLEKSGEDVSDLLQDTIARKKIFHYDEIRKFIEPDKKLNRQAKKAAPCRYFNGRPGSCRKGEDCDFDHSSVSQNPFAARGGKK